MLTQKSKQNFGSEVTVKPILSRRLLE